MDLRFDYAELGSYTRDGKDCIEEAHREFVKHLRTEKIDKIIKYE